VQNLHKKKKKKKNTKPSTVASTFLDELAPAAGLLRILRVPVARTTVSPLGT